MPPFFSQIRVSLPSSKSIFPKNCCFDGKELVKVTRSHSQGWASRRRRHQSHPRRSRRRHRGHGRRHESHRGDTPTVALVRIDATLERTTSPCLPGCTRSTASASSAAATRTGTPEIEVQADSHATGTFPVMTSPKYVRFHPSPSRTPGSRQISS